MDVADSYVTFVRHSQDMLREKVNEEVYVERLFDVSTSQSISPLKMTTQFHNFFWKLVKNESASLFPQSSVLEYLLFVPSSSRSHLLKIWCPLSLLL